MESQIFMPRGETYSLDLAPSRFKEKEVLKILKDKLEGGPFDWVDQKEAATLDDLNLEKRDEPVSGKLYGLKPGLTHAELGKEAHAEGIYEDYYFRDAAELAAKVAKDIKASDKERDNPNKVLSPKEGIIIYIKEEYQTVTYLLEIFKYPEGGLRVNVKPYEKTEPIREGFLVMLKPKG